MKINESDGERNAEDTTNYLLNLGQYKKNRFWKKCPRGRRDEKELLEYPRRTSFLPLKSLNTSDIIFRPKEFSDMSSMKNLESPIWGFSFLNQHP